MTEQGEAVGPHRDPAPAAAPAAGAHTEGEAGSADRRPSPRIWAALAGVIVVGLGAALWVDSSDGSGLLSGSQAAAGPGAVAGPGPAASSSADPDAFGVERYFPAQRTVDEGVAAGRRTASREGTACADVLQGATAARLRKVGGCGGYIGATYTRADGAVLTTVTVLRFADAGRARRAAGLLGGRAGDVTFDLPDGAAQAAVAPPPPPADALFSRVAVVGDYVTVTSSAFADNHQPTIADQDQLEQATRAVAYAAGAQFMWY